MAVTRFPATKERRNEIFSFAANGTKISRAARKYRWEKCLGGMKFTAKIFRDSHWNLTFQGIFKAKFSSLVIYSSS